MKLEDTQTQQQTSIEKEDYDEAELLNSRIQQTKALIVSKESQIKKIDDDINSYESKKGDLVKETKVLIEKAIGKIKELKAK